MLHASAIVTEAGVVAFCGSSGAGKSTLAAAFSRRQYPVWADDALAVSPPDAAVAAFPLPFRLRIDSEAASRLDAIVGAPAQTRSRQVQLPLRAIALLGRNASLPTPSVRSISSQAALLRLLEQAYCFSLSDKLRKKRLVESFLGLASRVDTYEITYAPRFEQLPALLRSIEAAIFPESAAG